MVRGTAEIGPPLSDEARLRLAVRYLGDELGRAYVASVTAEDSVTIRLRPRKMIAYHGGAGGAPGVPPGGRPRAPLPPGQGAGPQGIRRNPPAVPAGLRRHRPHPLLHYGLRPHRERPAGVRGGGTGAAGPRTQWQHP